MDRRWISWRALVLLVSLALAGCGSTGAGGPGSEGSDGGSVADDGGSTPALDGGSTPAEDGGSTPALDGGPKDGGADAGVQDAGTVHDAGTTHDAGTADAGIPNLHCLTSGCASVAGNYQGCLNCGLLGTFGPAEVDVTQTGCQFRACVPVDGGLQCADGCVDNHAALSFNISYNGFDVTCSGPFHSANHGIDLSCPFGLGSCDATLLPVQLVCQ